MSTHYPVSEVSLCALCLFFSIPVFNKTEWCVYWSDV